MTWLVGLLSVGAASGAGLLLFLQHSGLYPSPRPPAEIEVYFSPDGGARERLLKAMNHCKKSLDLAAYDLTSGSLARSLADLYERGVTVRVIADDLQRRGKHSEVEWLDKQGVDIRITRGPGGRIMHHKFAIIDGRLLFTGSYNWTDSAEERNSENLLVLTSPRVISAYQQEFDRLWSRAREVPHSKEKGKRGRKER